MKLLTFLGTAKYTETTYVLNGQGYTTCYCPAAMAHFCQPETTLVVVTKDAKAMHFEKLADEISLFTNPIAVHIPDGHSEADLWAIFESLTEAVNREDTLVVDITNGFRSLPFLSFLAIAFLRIALQVEVQRVYYGAWEARNETTNESPIFDLTPFVALLDWIIATDRFTRFGDASDLAVQLRQGMPPGPLMGSDLRARQIGQALRKAADAMETVSLALRLTRPLETMQASADLVATLEGVGALVGQQTRPFELLAEQVRQRYEPLTISTDPLNRTNWSINLQIQLGLIRRYLEQGQVVQAVTLAREWLVSLLVYHFKGQSLIDHDRDRQPVENTLNNEVERHKPNPRPPLQPAYDELFQALSNHREIGKIWDKLTTLRNDIAHVGMNLNPKQAKRLQRDIQNLEKQLDDIGANIFALHESKGASS